MAPWVSGWCRASCDDPIPSIWRRQLSINFIIIIVVVVVVVVVVSVAVTPGQAHFSSSSSSSSSRGVGGPVRARLVLPRCAGGREGVCEWMWGSDVSGWEDAMGHIEWEMSRKMSTKR